MARSDNKRHSGKTRKPAAIDHEPISKGPKRASVPDAEPIALAQLSGPKVEQSTSSPDRVTEANHEGEKTAPSNDKIASFTDTTSTNKDNDNGKDDMASKQNSTLNNNPTPDHSKKGSSGLLAGVAGGVIAVVLAGALQFSGVIPPLSNNNQAATDINSGAASQNLQKELAALRSEVAKLKDQGQQQLINADTSASNIDKSLIDAATKTAEEARAIADKAQQSLSDIHQSTNAFATEFDGIKSELASLKTNLTQNATAELHIDDPQLRALEGKLNALDESLAQFKTATDQRFNGIQSDLDTAKQLENLVAQNTTNIAKNSNSLESLAVEVKKIPDPLAERAKSMTTLIAANALKSAIDRGGSYVNELATFEGLAPEGLSLDELKKYAKSGIASHATLSEEFSSIADAIASTDNEVASNANWGEKAWSYAKGFVAIRPVGNVEGDNAGAIAARMEVAIKEGDYDRAANEWQKLPQSGKDVSASFMDKLKVRNNIDHLLAQLVNLSINPEAASAPLPSDPLPPAPHETAPSHEETQP